MLMVLFFLMPAVYILGINENGTPDGNLTAGRLLLSKNGIQVDNLGRQRLSRSMKSIGKFENITAKGRPPVTRSSSFAYSRKSGKRREDIRIVSTILHRAQRKYGFTIAFGEEEPHKRNNVKGLYIQDIIKGGVADKDGKLQVGDRIVSINGIEVDGLTLDEVREAVNLYNKYMSVLIERGVNAENPSRALTSTTTHNSLWMYQAALSSTITLNAMLFKDITGYGVLFERKNDDIFITRIIRNGPAEKEGTLRANDRVISINGMKVHGMDMDSVNDIIGKESFFIEIVVERTLIKTTKRSSTPATPAELRPSTTLPTLFQCPDVKERGRRMRRKLVHTEIWKGHRGYGFVLVNARPPFEKIIYISKIKEDGSVAKNGKLKVGDRMVSVNNIQATDIKQVIRLLAENTMVKIVAERQVTTTEKYFSAVVHRDEHGLGFLYSFCYIGPSSQGRNYAVYISKIEKGGNADDGRFMVGDQIVSINGVNILTLPSDKILEMMTGSMRSLKFVLIRQVEVDLPPSRTANFYSTHVICSGPTSCLDCRTLMICAQNKEGRYVESRRLQCSSAYPYCDRIREECVDYTPMSCGTPVNQDCYVTGIYPSMRRCDEYYSCSIEKTLAYMCGTFETFDIKTLKCKQGGHCARYSCRGMEGRGVPFQNNPRLYVVCKGGRGSILGKCQLNERFDQIAQKCKYHSGASGNILNVRTLAFIIISSSFFK